MPTPTIHAIIKDKNGIIVEDNYTALSSYNDVGLFDVLPLHTNFISLIKNKIIARKGENQKEIKVGTGLLQVIGGQVHIFLGLPDASAAANAGPSESVRVAGKPTESAQKPA